MVSIIRSRLNISSTVIGLGNSIYEITPFQSARRVFLFDSYELVRNRPGLNQIKVLVASNDYGADLCAKRNCYGCFTSSKMDRLVYWSVFLVYVVGCASLQDARQCAME